MPKNTAKSALEAQVAPEQNYQVPVNERDAYHVLQCRGGFNPETGQPLYEPMLQKYNAREFELFGKRSLEAQGWDLKILWDPRTQTNPTLQKTNANPNPNVK